MEIKTVVTCPLGSKCEEIKDGAVHRCAWFITLAGKNPTSGEQINERGCAMSWVPILLIENSAQQRATGDAVTSFRDTMTKENETSRQTAIAIARLQVMPKSVQIATIDAEEARVVTPK